MARSRPARRRTAARRGSSSTWPWWKTFPPGSARAEPPARRCGACLRRRTRGMRGLAQGRRTARFPRMQTTASPETATRPMRVLRLGLLPYGDGLAFQEDLVRRRRAGEVPDTLLLLEHTHVITLGSGSHAENVLVTPQERAARGIELFETGRGGDVTYHGPGQLVGYPIFDLKPDRQDLHRYLRDVEEALIGVLSDFGLEGGRKEGLTGVWVGDRKIAAIGVRVSSGWITSHGFALNVTTDLSFFGTIVPCGIRDHGVGSLSTETGREVPMAEVEASAVRWFARVFGRAPYED
ncbi:MAG TPA: lipoyl(octanoyl) transferase LipB [Longimicrobium sp.]|nr:lipoyl(octanoyl) transferase LipB [Longimicrobium sp.]